jgi:hypothetical protein
MPFRKLLLLLREPLERQEHLSALPLLGEQDAERLPVADRTNLVDVTLEVAGSREAIASDLLHRGNDVGHLVVGQGTEEVLDGATPCGGPIVTPSSPRLIFRPDHDLMIAARTDATDPTNEPVLPHTPASATPMLRAAIRCNRDPDRPDSGDPDKRQCDARSMNTSYLI